MGEAPYIFPEPQAEYLRALNAGRCLASDLSHRVPARVSLVDAMPPVYQQALQGTCVANAVTALLEYYGDCKTRLSVQYLAAVTKDVERAGLTRNLEALRTGGTLDAGFEALFHTELLQLRLLADTNGGLASPALRPYLARFEEGVMSRFNRAPGSLLVSCFHAVETRGVCRYALWPYAGARMASVFGEVGAALEVPPGADEDAAKRRVTHGLYLLSMANNVDEIRGLLAGTNGRRPMPVAVTVNFFADCDGTTYSFPETEELAEGRLASKNVWRGRHCLLLVGYEDNPKAPGGGWFLIRNSLGEDWGEKGYGRMPYAYLACFAVEAGTILQDRMDYEGDGYDGQRSVGESTSKKSRSQAFLLRLAVNLALALVLVGGTLWVASYERNKEAKIEGEPENGWMRPPMPGDPDANEKPPPAASRVRYKVFFSCENVEERQSLRTAFALENVPYPVEFMPQNLSSVLALRIVIDEEDDVYEALEHVLQQNYKGASKELWTDMGVLVRTRRVYAVKDTLRRWNGGL